MHSRVTLQTARRGHLSSHTLYACTVYACTVYACTVYACINMHLYTLSLTFHSINILFTSSTLTLTLDIRVLNCLTWYWLIWSHPLKNNFRKIIATVIHTDGAGGSIMMVVSLSVLSTWWSYCYASEYITSCRGTITTLNHSKTWRPDVIVIFKFMFLFWCLL